MILPAMKSKWKTRQNGIVRLCAIILVAALFGSNKSSAAQLNSKTDGLVSLVSQSYFLKQCLLLEQIQDPGQKVAAFDSVVQRLIEFDTKHRSQMSLTNPVAKSLAKWTQAEFIDYVAEQLESKYWSLADEAKFQDLLSSRPDFFEIPLQEIDNNPAAKAYYKSLVDSFNAYDFGIPGASVGFLRPVIRGGASALFGLLKQPGAVKLQIIANIENALGSRKKSLLLIPKQIIKLGHLNFGNPTDQRFFELLIGNYFSDISDESAQNILKKLIERPDKNSPMDIFRLLVHHSDPIFQKLLQFVARRPGFSPDLQAVFIELENSGMVEP